MGTFKDREDYLKGLCVAHPTVLHTGANIDGSPRKSFFRINNEEEIDAAMFNNIDFPCVAFMSITHNLRDNGDALIDIRHVFKNEWWFLKKVVTTTAGDGQGYVEKIQDAYDCTFAIMEDFIKSMKDDWEDNGACGAFQNFDINKISSAQKGPVVETEYGWAMYFEDEIRATRINS